MKTAAAVLMVTALTGSAAGQCTMFRNGMPDFDQKRDALPNDGTAFCVPTTSVNLFAYIANHGRPMVLAGPRDWQDNLWYSFVSGQIFNIGNLMGTDPLTGTTGNHAYLGTQYWLNLRAPGVFTVSQFYGDFDVELLRQHTLNNRLLNVCYGYYVPNQVGQYSRAGGHCVTLTGLINACDPSYELRWRDPANNGALTSQSLFTSKYSHATSETFFGTDGNERNRIRLLDLGTDSTTRRYLDSYLSVKPILGLSGGLSSSPGEWHIYHPVQIASMATASTSSIVPDPDAVTQIAVDAQDLNAFVVTSQAAPRENKVWRYNLATGEYREIFASDATLKVATSRHGDLFVAGDGSVRKYAFPAGRGGAPGGVPTLVRELAVPLTFTALTYDDALDEVVGLTTTGRLLRIGEALANGGINEPLPGGVTITGAASLVIDPQTQKYIVCGAGSPTLWALTLIPGSPRLQVQSSWTLPGAANPAALQMSDDRTIIAIHDGVLSEFEEVVGAGWRVKVGSPYNGLAGERTLAIGRSRTNFRPGVHDTRKWDNVLVVEDVPEVPDCDADFNEDGRLDSSDFFAFIGAFFESSILADWTHDGRIDSSDFFGYLGAFFRGC